MKTLEKILIYGTIVGSSLVFVPIMSEGSIAKSVYSINNNKQKDAIEERGRFSWYEAQIDSARFAISLFTDIKGNEYINVEGLDDTYGPVRLDINEHKQYPYRGSHTTLSGKDLKMWFEYPDSAYFGDETIFCISEFREGKTGPEIEKLSLNSLYAHRFGDIMAGRNSVLDYYVGSQPTIPSDGFRSFTFWSKQFVGSIAREAQNSNIISLDLDTADYFRDQARLFLDEIKTQEEDLELKPKGRLLRLQNLRPSAVTLTGPPYPGAISTKFSLDQKSYHLVYSKEDSLWHLKEAK